MGTQLPNSLLYIQSSYADEDWFTEQNDNWQRLYETLLYLSNLLDVDVTGISSGDVLQWNAANSKWEPYTPTHNPLGAPKTSTTTSTTTTTTTTTVWMMDFTSMEDYTVPADVKKHWQVSSDADHFAIYAGSMQFCNVDSEAVEYHMMSRFLLTGDPIEVVASCDFPEACHPSGSSNYPLILSFWNLSRTRVAGVNLAINYYYDYRRNFGVHVGLDPIAFEVSETNSANAPMDTPFSIKLYKGGSVMWAWYWKDGTWNWATDPAGYAIDDEWFSGPVWVEMYGYRQNDTGLNDYRIRSFSVLKGAPMTFPSTTTTTTTTTNTLTTTTQTVPLNDEGFDPTWSVTGRFTYSDSDKLAEKTGGSGDHDVARSKAYVMEGMPEGTKFYFEVYCLTDSGSRYWGGLANENTDPAVYPGSATDTGVGLWGYTGNIYHNGAAITTGLGGQWYGISTVMVAFDIHRASQGLGRCWIGLNGTWSTYYHDTGSTEVPYLRPNVWELTGTRFYACGGAYYTGRALRLLTRSEDWTYAAPTGFVAIPCNDV